MMHVATSMYMHANVVFQIQQFMPDVQPQKERLVLMYLLVLRECSGGRASLSVATSCSGPGAFMTPT
jgi:hypothetical protein